MQVEETLQATGEAIRERRLELGLTQADLVARMKFSRARDAYISAIESGDVVRADLRITRLLLIANALDFALPDLLHMICEKLLHQKGGRSEFDQACQEKGGNTTPPRRENP